MFSTDTPPPNPKQLLATDVEDPICFDGVERLRLRVHGREPSPTLIYVPGIHGDWTMIGAFRAALGPNIRFIEMTYPRSLTWTITDYAHAIEESLFEKGIKAGWLLGESFGSQVAWELVSRSRLQYQGIILAGGFVQYPVRGFLRTAQFAGPRVPHRVLRRLLPLYLHYAKLRHRNLPEAIEGARQFVARRTALDQDAAVWRLELISQSDPRVTASSTHIPVHHIYGLLDPIVPWLPVASWLQKNCSSLRASRRVWYSDHTILASAATESAEYVRQWMA